MTTTVLLVFARCAGLLFRAPGFSHPSVAPPIRVGLALVLALATAPHVRPAAITHAALFALAVAGEALLGAALGTGASLLYDAAYYAGRTIDDYVGIRGSVPSAHVTSAQAFGRLWSAVFLAGFFLLDGYVPVVRALVASFDVVPPGGALPRDAWLHFALALPTAFVSGAALIAAPALAAALTLHVALAAIARVVPRLANFSLTFPVVFAGALVVSLVGLSTLAPLAGRPWLVLPFGAP